MNMHENARLTPRGRVEAVRRVCALGQSARQVARAQQVRDKTGGAGGGWRRRRGRLRLPACPAGGATSPAVALRIKVLCHQHRLTSQAIAHAVGVSRATVARIVAAAAGHGCTCSRCRPEVYDATGDPISTPWVP
jgi:hypothetical protein